VNKDDIDPKKLLKTIDLLKHHLSQVSNLLEFQIGNLKASITCTGADVVNGTKLSLERLKELSHLLLDRLHRGVEIAFITPGVEEDRIALEFRDLDGRPGNPHDRFQQTNNNLFSVIDGDRLLPHELREAANIRNQENSFGCITHRRDVK
jgi:hypothetical protein